MNKTAKKFYDLYFTVDWIVKIFFENIIYDRELRNQYSSREMSKEEVRQKGLFQSAAFNYAFILLAEIWKTSNRKDDITILSNLYELKLIVGDEDHKYIDDIIDLFEKTRENNATLFKRLYLKRNKKLGHITSFKPKIVEDKNNPEYNVLIYLETEFNSKEVLFLVNSLVDILNKSLGIYLKNSFLDLDKIKKLHF